MAKHHPDLIMCRKQPGIGTAALGALVAIPSETVLDAFMCAAAIGRLCEKCKLQHVYKVCTCLAVTLERSVACLVMQVMANV